ncbi:MAG TPA: hypothetical protein VE669_12335 [Actinomycetota bacterium]|nr:hypothetical protein [Actinomycetota bacterium]
MLGWLARRERRAFWAVSSLVVAAGIGLAMWAAAQARNEARAEASSSARTIAQTRLAPLLGPRDLTAPIVGERATELDTDIGRTITSVSPIEDVRIYSSGGRILYARDPAIVGTKPSYLRTYVAEVANGRARSWIRGGLLQTHVPIWLTPGGTVVVAEMSQPFGPVAMEANGRWYALAAGLGLVLLGTIAMAVKTARLPAPTPFPLTGSRPAPTRRPERERAPSADAPVYEYSGFRRMEERRQEAERRAAAAEESVQGIQKQLHEALAQIEEMEAKLTMAETQTTQSDGEMQALRDQLRETADRLHRSELDNHALRERLALRRHELDQAGSASADGEARALRARLAAAERQVEELTETMGKLEAELDYTRSRFHLSMLTAALHEFDNDDIQIEERNGKQDPVIVRRASLHPGKVR